MILLSLLHVNPGTECLNTFDPPKQLGWGLLCLGMVLASLYRSGRLVCRGPVFFALLLIGWIILRTFTRTNPMVESKVLATWLLPLTLFLSASMQPARMPASMGYGLILAAFLQMILMVLQYFGYGPFSARVFTSDLHSGALMIGTVGYHNQAADFISLCMLGALPFLPGRRLKTGCALVVLFTVGLTGSRGGFLALLGALSACLLVSIRLSTSLNRKRLAWSIPFILLVLLLSTLLLPGVGPRMRELATSGINASGIAPRQQMAAIAINMWAEKPITGWGAGEYAYQYIPRLGDRLPAKPTHEDLQSVVYAREAHNDYLQVAAEFGVIGVGLFLAWSLSLLIGLRKPAGWAPEVFVVVGVLCYMGIKSLISFPWQITLCGPLAGLLLGLNLPKSAKSQTPAYSILDTLAAVIVTALSVLLTGVFWSAATLNTEVYKRLDPARSVIDVPWSMKYIEPASQVVYASGLALINGRLDLAENMLRDSTERHLSMTSINNLANVLTRQGQWDEAAEWYLLWARSGIQHQAALLNLSVAYEQAGRFLQAAECLTTLRTMWTDWTEERAQREAFLYLQAGKYRAAIRVLNLYRQTAALHQLEVSPTLDNMQGAAYLKASQYKRAEKWLRSALEKDPTLVSAQKNLETVLRLKHNHPEE